MRCLVKCTNNQNACADVAKRLRGQVITSIRILTGLVRDSKNIKKKIKLCELKENFVNVTKDK